MNTIKDLLAELKVECAEEGQHHHARSGWIQLKHCPFCGSNNYHLGIHLSGRFAACWRCSGHHIFAVLSKLGVSKKDLGGVFRDYVPQERKRTGLKEPKGRGPLGHCHELYLMRRGFKPEELVRVWQIEGIGLAARLKWRLYIPIIYKGERVSWTTRAIGEKVEQRYISAGPDEEAVNHKRILYGFDYVANACVVVEGPIDVWAIGPGAVATMGTAYTTAQVRLLARVPCRTVCFDSTPDAQARARQLAAQLSCFLGSTQLLELDAKDAGEASAKELKLLRRSARL